MTLTITQKNYLSILLAIIFPFFMLSTKISSEKIYKTYLAIDHIDTPLLLRLAFFLTFHFWGSWLAIFFTSFQKTTKIVLAAFFTIPMSWLMMLLTFQAVCTYLVQYCVHP